MCGIIGTTELDIPEKILKKGLSLMTNRGPDFKKLRKYKFGYFGHTRLAINLQIKVIFSQPVLTLRLLLLLSLSGGILVSIDL